VVVEFVFVCIDVEVEFMLTHTLVCVDVGNCV